VFRVDALQAPSFADQVRPEADEVEALPVKKSAQPVANMLAVEIALRLIKLVFVV